jgi:plastocyanin
VKGSLVSGLAAGFVLVVATACGGSGATQAPQATSAPQATQASATQAAASQPAAGVPTCSQNLAAGQQVGISGNTFLPGTLSVSSGTSVTWTNTDQVNHTVTFDAGPDCGQVSTGQSVTAQFPGPGSYAYHCRIHPSMHGTITVS